MGSRENHKYRGLSRIGYLRPVQYIVLRQGYSLLTWILKETPCASKLATLFEDAVAEVGVSFLQSVGKADTSYARSYDDDILIETDSWVGHG